MQRGLSAIAEHLVRTGSAADAVLANDGDRADRPLLNLISALHGMPAWTSDDKVSVCLSVKCVHCDKMEERSVQIFTGCKDHLA